MQKDRRPYTPKTTTMAKTSLKKKVDIAKLKTLLTAVRNSCEEGLDGSWDCTTNEGRESFEAMSVDCEEIAAELGVKLKPYSKK